MNDGSESKELVQLQGDAKTGLCRREFATRLKGLGFGFAAAFMLGLNRTRADAIDSGARSEGKREIPREVLAQGKTGSGSGSKSGSGGGAGSGGGGGGGSGGKSGAGGGGGGGGSGGGAGGKSGAGGGG